MLAAPGHSLQQPKGARVRSTSSLEGVLMCCEVDCIRVYSRELEARRRNHFALSAAIQEGRCYSPPRPRTTAEQGMDEHQRDELRCEAPGDAAHACVRGRDVLHHVQPVRLSSHVHDSWLARG